MNRAEKDVSNKRLVSTPRNHMVNRASQVSSHSHSQFFTQNCSRLAARRISGRRYLKADVERRARVYVLKVAVLFAGIDVDFVVHRDRGQVFVGKAIGW